VPCAQRFMEVLCLLSRGPWRSPRALADDLELFGCCFFVLVGIVIPLFFLRANFSLGIYRRILGHICDEIWVMGHNEFWSCRDQLEFPWIGKIVLYIYLP
jgi:hypothetical protein